MKSTAKSKNPKVDFETFGTQEEKDDTLNSITGSFLFIFPPAFLSLIIFLGHKHYFCFNVRSVAEAKSEGKISDALSGLVFVCVFLLNSLELRTEIIGRNPLQIFIKK